MVGELGWDLGDNGAEPQLDTDYRSMNAYM